MFSVNYSKKLEEGEGILQIVRRHPITMAGSLTLAAILILTDFFFLTWLTSQGLWGIILFILIIAFTGLLILHTWVIWSKNAFVITNKRVVDIDQKGFFNKVVSECNYDKIQDVSYKIKGIFATLFHFGSIEIQTAGNIANLELMFIKNPEKVQALIMDQQRKYSSLTPHEELSREELLGALNKVKEKLGEEEFKKIIRP